MSLKRFVIAVLLLLSSQPAWAWWDSGHILVAEVAWAHMEADTKAEVEVLLAYHPDPLVRTMAESSLWPDLVRVKEHPFHKYHRDTWHYQNLPVQRYSDGVERDLVFGGDLNEQLARQVELMADESLPKSERAVALSWVVHLLGDIHQPLHNASLFSEQYPRGDQGGNLFKVTLDQKKISLHGLWDSGGGRFLNPVSPQKLHRYRRLYEKHHPPESFAGRLQISNPEAWAQEGLKLAREVVYRPDVVQGEELPQETKQQAVEISERQVTLAGYRLARLLDRKLGARPAWFTP